MHRTMHFSDVIACNVLTIFVRSDHSGIGEEIDLCLCSEVSFSTFCLQGKMGQSTSRHKGYEKLLDRLDDVTTKTETINYLPEDIKAMATQIELKWLERKELMRQEFASLLETITTQQQKLMADMEEEMKLSLQHLEKLQKAHEEVLSTTCQLSDDCISAVQSLPREEFLKSYPQFLESAKSLVNQVEKMSSPDDCMPAFLQLPFSLHKEKVHLHDSLQLGAFDCQRIRAIEYNRFIPQDRVKEEIAVNMLVNCPQPDDIPTSCTLHYTAAIFCGSRQIKRKPAWENKEPLIPTDVVLNGSHGFNLAPGSLYLVKIHPVITITTHQGDKTFDGKVVSIVIVTGAGTDAVRRPLAAGDGQVIDTATDTSRLLGTKCNDFHGNTGALACFNTAWAGNQNNNSNRTMQTNNSISTWHNHNSVSNNMNSNLNNSTVPCLIRPGVEAVFQVPDFSEGILRPSEGGWNVSLFETIKCVSDQDMLNTGFDNDLEVCKGRMQCQKRYASICSFEEARLLEDTHLKI
ncbi:uncharacterized protein [Littorina saxatilis]|uniref:uncharacterized protein isoform X2 n=1 Tax=Littorina saxatilis TaxID=31220 RepID=UPI0038B61D2C